MMMTREELEDEAAGPAIRDEDVGARVLRLDGLATRPFLFRSLPTPAAQGDGPEKFKELAPLPAKLRRRSGEVQILLLPHPPRRGVSDAKSDLSPSSSPLSSSSLLLEEELPSSESPSEELSTQHFQASSKIPEDLDGEEVSLH